MSQASKILVVTCSHQCYREYHEALNAYPWKDVEAVHAPDGQEAIQYLCENPDTSLIMFDMNTLAGGVLDFLKEVRQSHSLGSIPVILLTGRDVTAETSEAIEAGAFSFLTNPITRERLYMHLDVILDR